MSKSIEASLVEESVLWMFGGSSSSITFEELNNRLDANKFGERIRQVVKDPNSIDGFKRHLAAETDRSNPDYLWRGGSILLDGLVGALAKAIRPHLLPGTVPPPRNELERLASELMSNPNYIEDLIQAASFGIMPEKQTPKRTFLEAIDIANLSIPAHHKRSSWGNLAQSFSDRRKRVITHQQIYGREL